VASKGRKKPSLHDLSRTRLGQGVSSKIIEEMLLQSDRGCALVAAAILDMSLLRLLLDMRLRIDLTEGDISELFFERHSSLASFSSKIDISFALNIISRDEMKELDVIRRIRNSFAHSVAQISFNNELVTSEVSKLQFFDEGFLIERNNCTIRNLFEASTMHLYFAIIERSTKKIKAERDALSEIIRKAETFSQEKS
jgi:hypothetical protein